VYDDPMMQPLPAIVALPDPAESRNGHDNNCERLALIVDVLVIGFCHFVVVAVTSLVCCCSSSSR
jgi:2-methylaconitate cis-trans-isomerase PrpF